jgi:hypothetical protein
MFHQRMTEQRLRYPLPTNPDASSHRTAYDLLRCATGQGHRVEQPLQVHDDGFRVRRDRHRHVCAFGDSDVTRALAGLVCVLPARVIRESDCEAIWRFNSNDAECIKCPQGDAQRVGARRVVVINGTLASPKPFASRLSCIWVPPGAPLLSKHSIIFDA